MRKLVSAFPWLIAFCLITFLVMSCTSAHAIEPVPTAAQIEESWITVDTIMSNCGSWMIFTNPDITSRYSVAYVHRCIYFSGQVSQHGFLDNGKLREFEYREIGAPAVEVYRHIPGLEEKLIEYLPKSKST